MEATTPDFDVRHGGKLPHSKQFVIRKDSASQTPIKLDKSGAIELANI